MRRGKQEKGKESPEYDLQKLKKRFSEYSKINRKLTWVFVGIDIPDAWSSASISCSTFILQENGGVKNPVHEKALPQK